MAKATRKGGNPRTVPEGKTQVNFNISNEILEKVKVVAFVEGVTNSEIYNRATAGFIDTYEKKNGKVKPIPKGKGF